MGISIETPWGNLVATGDLKLDHDNGIPMPHEQKKWGDLGKDNNLSSSPTPRTQSATASPSQSAA